MERRSISVWTHYGFYVGTEAVPAQSDETLSLTLYRAFFNMPIATPIAVGALD